MKEKLSINSKKKLFMGLFVLLVLNIIEAKVIGKVNLDEIKQTEEEPKQTFPAEGHEIVEIKKEINSTELSKELSKEEQGKSEEQKQMIEEKTLKEEEIKNDKVNEQNEQVNDDKKIDYNEIPKPKIQSFNENGKEEKEFQDEQNKENNIIKNDINENIVKEEVDKNEKKAEEEKEEENIKDDKKNLVEEKEKNIHKEKDHKSSNKNFWMLESFGRFICFITGRFYCPFNSENKDKSDNKKSSSKFNSMSNEEIDSLEMENKIEGELKEGDEQINASMKATYIKSEVDESGKLQSNVKEYSAELHN